MIRVLIADDSPTVRSLLAGLISADPGFRVVAQVGDGVAAAAEARRLRPDLILMDLYMPGQDGLAATKQVMAEAPCPIVIVSAAARPDDVELSLRALQAGALMVQPIPAPASPDSAQARQLRATLRALAEVKVVRQRRDRGTSGEVAVRPGRRGARARVVAMAVSTGGPMALRRVFGALPADFPAPILAVQHMSPGFIGGMVHWLMDATPLRVRVAQQGDRLESGTVYFAPDNLHLGCAGGQTVLSAAPPINGFRPSATHLFASVADVFGPSAVGLVMTGMGSDGLEGLQALASRGAEVLAQDEDSSVVYGMAREAVRTGLTTAVLDLEAIPGRLLELVR